MLDNISHFWIRILQIYCPLFHNNNIFIVQNILVAILSVEEYIDMPSMLRHKP